MLDIKEKSRQSIGSVTKAIRKKVISQATSKYICGKAIARVFEEHHDWEQRRYSKKNSGMGMKERSK